MIQIVGGLLISVQRLRGREFHLISLVFQRCVCLLTSGSRLLTSFFPFLPYLSAHSPRLLVTVSMTDLIARTTRFTITCKRRIRKPVGYLSLSLRYRIRANAYSFTAAMFYVGSNVMNWPLEAQRASMDEHEICVRTYCFCIFRPRPLY